MNGKKKDIYRILVFIVKLKVNCILLIPVLFLLCSCRQDRASSSQVEIDEEGYDDFGRRINTNKMVMIVSREHCLVTFNFFDL